jgi:ubiquinone/menaquinone biosynthesis C-methylase UbiE
MGTGTGEWVIEVADQYPTAKVYGLDLSLIQTTVVPSNAEFIVTDISKSLEFKTGQTDLVHSRHTLMRDLLMLDIYMPE